MSASDKKKLRKEQAQQLLTERQRQEQAEAKKLKLYTSIFVASIALIVVIALAILCVNGIQSSGIIEKSTIAATVDGNKLNTVEMSYYFNDAVSEVYNEWAGTENADTALLQVMGLDTSVALNEQTNPQTNQLWSEYFLDVALEDAKEDYAIYKQAKAEGFELPAEKQEEIDNVINNIKMYASMYGYNNPDQYLRLSYGNGATAKSYKEYYERTQIAEAYAQAHEEGLTYDDAKLREYESDKYDNYTSFEYTNLYVSYNAFLESGEDSEDGTTTNTDEQKDAARAALQAAADTLVTATSPDDLEVKAKNLKVNEGTTLNVNKNQRSLYSTLTATNADLAAWIIDEKRADGDIGAIPVKSTAEGDNEAINGYYIVIFHSKDENKAPMSNVRHLLVKFATDEEAEDATPTDEQKAAAKETAEGYLKTWKEGEATEQSFIDLILEHSEDNGVEENEGLYENITPDSNYVENFLNWSIDPARKVGDTEIVETEYGYHIMYFVGHSELTYRDSMLTQELRAADHEKWHTDTVAAVTAELGNTGKMRLDLILSPVQ